MALKPASQYRNNIVTIKVTVPPLQIPMVVISGLGKTWKGVEPGVEPGKSGVRRRQTSAGYDAMTSIQGN